MTTTPKLQAKPTLQHPDTTRCDSNRIITAGSSPLRRRNKFVLPPTSRGLWQSADLQSQVSTSNLTVSSLLQRANLNNKQNIPPAHNSVITEINTLGNGRKHSKIHEQSKQLFLRESIQKRRIPSIMPAEMHVQSMTETVFLHHILKDNGIQHIFGQQTSHG